VSAASVTTTTQPDPSNTGSDTGPDTGSDTSPSDPTPPTFPAEPSPPTTAVPATPTVNVYSHAGAGDLSPAVANAKSYVYVPSNDAGSVTVIDQQTTQVVGQFKVGKLPQHVVPSWDLRTLYATVSDADRLVSIDPTTGKPGKAIPVIAPYNLYFTPDGTTAVVMAERRNRIEFYDTATWKLIRSVDTGRCRGVNHADWSADGTFFLATCEFSGDLIKVDTATETIVDTLPLEDGAMPQDLRLAPDGAKFYVADMQHAGVWVVDADGAAVTGFIPTGTGAHGIYPSRDGTLMYVTNRGRTMEDGTGPSHDGQGSVSVVDPTTDTVTATWTIPGGGSPDMGGVSADGRTLWLSGRYDSVVYAFDTTTGALRARIAVPSGPHGLCVFPQPGRFSLGHTGNVR
jgi:YVTN family beta-propeller protein